MRRFIFSLLIVTLLASATFATSKPSLDGRAVVAEEGVLPAGLFAKTVGYLPGDSVSVTNPATGITINVLILGSIDPSAGVAILLSPEAADKLFITPDSNTQVRITKRTGMLDESVSGAGTVISDTPADTLLPNQLRDDLDSQLGTVDKTLNPVHMDETLGTAPTLAKSTEEPVTKPATPEPAGDMEPVEENTPEVALVPEAEAVAMVEDTEPVQEPVPAENDSTSGSDDLTTPDYTITSVEEVPMNHVLAENNPVYIVESVDPTNPTMVECDEDTSAPQAADTTTEEIILVPVEKPVDETPSFAPADPLLASTEDETMMETEESLLAAAAEDTNLVDPFAPIILVPADENPPLEAASTFTPVPVHAAPEPVLPAESAVAKAAAPTATSGLGAKQAHLVKNLSQLESGKYYVQIATFAEQANIDNLLATYGNQYPIVMVPMKSGKAMQMMVGPLNVDEYGAIMAKFKNLGFKDSFLRKIR